MVSLQRIPARMGTHCCLRDDATVSSSARTKATRANTVSPPTDAARDRSTQLSTTSSSITNTADLIRAQIDPIMWHSRSKGQKSTFYFSDIG